MNKIKETSFTLLKSLIKPKNKMSLIPNWLSFSRAIGGILIPVMVYSNAPLALLGSAISFLAISDFLDGKVARSLKCESEEGALLDAFSDKFFSLSLIIAILPKMPIFALNGVLEAAIAYTNVSSFQNGGKPKSNFLGKVKIWPLSIALGLSYLSVALNAHGFNISVLNDVATMLCVGTGVLEAVNIKQYKDEAKKDQHKILESNNIELDQNMDERIALKSNNIELEKVNKGLSLDKNKKPCLMVYELDYEDEMEKGRSKSIRRK